MRAYIFAFGLILLTVGGAIPAGAAQTVLSLEGVTEYRGTCDRLVIAGADRSASCGGTVTSFTNIALGGDRGVFRFESGAIAVRFNGSGPRVRPGVNSALVVAAAGSGATSGPGTGTCEFTAASDGRANIRCAAQTDAGEYSISFTSDGQPPT